MTKKQKTLLGIGAIGIALYWIYTRNKANKSLNPFAKSSSFSGMSNYSNATGYAIATDFILLGTGTITTDNWNSLSGFNQYKVRNTFRIMIPSRTPNVPNQVRTINVGTLIKANLSNRTKATLYVPKNTSPIGYVSYEIVEIPINVLSNFIG